MRFSPGHIFGLVISVATTGIGYVGWGWVVQLTRKTVLYEYRILIGVIIAIIILSALQWLWDKFEKHRHRTSA